VLAQPNARTAALVGLADQAVYSLTNLALAVVVAASVPIREFGIFSVLFLAYTLLGGVVEAFAGETYVVHHSVGGTDSAQARSAVSGFAVGLGVIAGVVAIASWVVAPSDTTQAVAAFGAVLPFLLLQNVWRSVLFADENATGALFNDLTWAGTQVVAVILALTLFDATVTVLVLAWGLGAIVASLVGIGQTGALPRPLEGAWWVRKHGRSSAGFGFEFLSLYGASQLVIVLIGVFAGLEDIARFRVAQLIFGPINIAINGARIAMTPLAAQRLVQSAASLKPFIRNLGLGLAGSAGLWGLAALLMPESIWARLFGDSWPGSDQLLLPFALGRVFLALGFAAVVGMRALKAGRASLVSRTASALFSIGLGGLGAWISGAEGAAYGVLAATLLGSAFMWERYRDAMLAGSR
jgi:O-antigen/teichoic acid export membrane protein